MAISGLAYNAIEFGPVPQRWDRVYSAFDEVEEQIRLVQGQECMSMKAGAAADTSFFSEPEIEIINEVCEKMKGLSSREISQLSHKEGAWKEHVGKPGAIPFSEAFKLVGI